MKKKFAGGVDVSSIMTEPMTSDEVMEELYKSGTDSITKVMLIPIEDMMDYEACHSAIANKFIPGTLDVDYQRVDYSIIGSDMTNLVVEVTLWPVVITDDPYGDYWEEIITGNDDSYWKDMLVNVVDTSTTTYLPIYTSNIDDLYKVTWDYHG